MSATACPDATIAAAPAAGLYLAAYLEPLSPFLARRDVTDLLVQRPGELWIEAGGALERHAAPQVTAPLVGRLARQVAAASHQAVSRAHPLLAATLPTGERVQVVLPPATRGFPALAIRRQVVSDLRLADLAADGAFADTRRASGRNAVRSARAPLAQLHERGDSAEFLAEAVRARCNIVVSGGTGSGKTTLLNALLKEIPAAERLVAIEDTAELVLGHANSLGLVAARGQGEAHVSTDDLLQATLRLRPDRILLGELRGAEAYGFLRAVNTGHPGSITTVHADSCAGAFEQLALMVLQAGTALTRREILDYVRGIVDVVVQVERQGLRRRVVEVAYARRRG